MASENTQENTFRVRLVPVTSLTRGADVAQIKAAQVEFKVTPQMSESGTVEYASITPVHLPGSIQVYKSTSSRRFDLTVKLISRNVADARSNMRTLQMLRSWRYPYFGKSGNSQQNMSRPSSTTGISRDSDEERSKSLKTRVDTSPGVNLLGAPPDVLYLYSYSPGTNDLRGNGPRVNLNRIPVVLTSLNLSYPDDVDYIPVFSEREAWPRIDSEPFPKKLEVSISLLETHAPSDYENFDLNAYKQGNLVGF